MHLFRGDSLPKLSRNTHERHRGRTFAEHFCSHGLMAKFADGGTSDLIHEKPLAQLVLEHVGYNFGCPEQKLADHSPLISFSEKLETAFNFGDRTKRLNLVPCDLSKATHFAWKLDFDLPSHEEPGLYEFVYEADYSNCLEHIQKQIQRGMYEEDLDDLAIGVMNAGVLTQAKNDQSNHYAKLINVTEFLKNKDLGGFEPRLVENALNRSKRDYEWLICPQDPMNDGNGFSARFSMNRHLQVHECYRVQK